MVRRLAVLPLVLAASACTADDRHVLIVDVRTDLEAGVAFDRALVELFDARGTFGERLRRVEARVVAGDDFTSGLRVAELDGLASGSYVVRAALVLEGALVVDAAGPLEIRENRAVTIDVSRACIGVACPPPSEPGASVCIAGTCAVPECLFAPDEPGCPVRRDAGVDGGSTADASIDGGVDAGGADASADAGVVAPDGYVLVPAGPFLMGCNPLEDTVCEPDELPRHEVTLDAFFIMVREVTMIEWASCIADGECAIPDDGASWTPMDTPDDPVVDVTRPEAGAYCRWAGGRLPTEAEWEKAARGTDGRVYPWGNDPPSCELANYVECGNVRMPADAFAGVESPYGTINMAGNVWEWVADFYGETYYETSASTNPRGPPTGTTWVIRGGSYDWPSTALRTSDRLEWDRPTFVIGLRCVRDLPEP